MGYFIEIKQLFKIFECYVVRYSLENQNLIFLVSAEWYDFGSDTLTFFLKTCCIFGSLCRMAKSLGVSPMKIQPFFVCLICKTLTFGWYWPQFAHDFNWRVKFGVNTCGN